MPLDLAVRMIVLPVQGGADIPEWIMFEFQGEIDRQKEAVSEEIHKLGTVKSSSLKAGRLEMIIGYHQLEGEIVSLKKPLAMLEKQIGSGAEGGEMQSVKQCTTAYKVVGVIRQKCLFKQRPRALISKPGKQ